MPFYGKIGFIIWLVARAASRIWRGEAVVFVEGPNNI